MLSRVQAATVGRTPSRGPHEVSIVNVVVSALPRLPRVVMAGVTPTNAREIAERARSAIAAAGVDFPRARYEVTIGQGCVHDPTTALDLGVAVGIFAAAGAVPEAALAGLVFWGELGLDGTLRTPRGALAVARRVRDLGLTLVCPASEVAALLRWLPDLRVAGVVDLEDLVAGLRAGLRLAEPLPVVPPPPPGPLPALEDQNWNEGVLSVVEAAVAARKPLLLEGPQGCGASMLAVRLPGIMPAPTPGEALGIATRASLAGLNPSDYPTHQLRPYRAPHYSVGLQGALAEVELARGGVLHLSGVEWFGAEVLEAVFRALPSDVQLVCSSFVSEVAWGWYLLGAPDEYLARVHKLHAFAFKARLDVLPAADGFKRGPVTTAEVQARVAAAWADAGTAHTRAVPAP